jgi:hypothetical protein
VSVGDTGELSCVVSDVISSVVVSNVVVPEAVDGGGV